MKIRLGGKSYAPDPNCKLGRYVKGLAEFTDLMHKLMNVIEEDAKPRYIYNVWLSLHWCLLL